MLTQVELNLWKKVKVLVTQSCPTLCDPMLCSLTGSSVHGVPQARNVHGVPQARNWSGLPFPSPGELPESEIKLRTPELQADSLPSEQPFPTLWDSLTCDYQMPFLTYPINTMKHQRNISTLIDSSSHWAQMVPFFKKKPQFLKSDIFLVRRQVGTG